MIGTTELIVIGGVALVLFGGAQLPKLAKSLGTFISDFNAAKEGKATAKPAAKKAAAKKSAKKSSTAKKSTAKKTTKTKKKK